ncbi:hypothetical protein NQZ68_018677 [Dissostichus eleginoides]|nr:hypothetical protein NQZ68_018677 [Dissostichus eleginoides]
MDEQGGERACASTRTCGDVGRVGKQAGFASFWKAYGGCAGPQPSSLGCLDG